MLPFYCVSLLRLCASRLLLPHSSAQARSTTYIFHCAFYRKQLLPSQTPTMASARMQRLRSFVQPDFDALPDRPASPQPEPQPESNPESNPEPKPDRSSDNSFNPNLDSMRLPTETATTPLTDVAGHPVADLKRGSLASPRHHFTPIQALSRYPYKYCSKSHMQDIASSFFDQGKFWQRQWDL